MKDYNYRLLKEYEYINSNVEKLGNFLNNLPDGIMLDTPIHILKRQLEVMTEYRDILKTRIDMLPIEEKTLLDESIAQ